MEKAITNEHKQAPGSWRYRNSEREEGGNAQDRLAFSCTRWRASLSFSTLKQIAKMPQKLLLAEPEPGDGSGGVFLMQMLSELNFHL